MHTPLPAVCPCSWAARTQKHTYVTCMVTVEVLGFDGKSIHLTDGPSKPRPEWKVEWLERKRKGRLWGRSWRGVRLHIVWVSRAWQQQTCRERVMDAMKSLL